MVEKIIILCIGCAALYGAHLMFHPFLDIAM
jgi:hypothetical protein